MSVGFGMPTESDSSHRTVYAGYDGGVVSEWRLEIKEGDDGNVLREWYGS